MKPRKAPEIFRAIDEAEPTHTLSEESLEQLRAAKVAAKDLIQTQTLGSEDKTYSVTLSGHANPGHEPASGMANDSVYVSITQSEEATS